MSMKSQRKHKHEIPSSRWASQSRLKPVVVDELEAVGLPSKGDSSLNTFAAQEEYFEKIVKRYEAYDAQQANDTEAFETTLASLSIARAQATKNAGLSQSIWSDNDVLSTPKGQISPLTKRLTAVESEAELATILMSMRKLREAIVATSRCDAFAKHSYLFICRVGVIYKAMETYQPTLLHLLRTIFPQTNDSSLQWQQERKEVIIYYLLDIICRRKDFNEALNVMQEYQCQSLVVRNVMFALIHDNWTLFWRAKASSDKYQRCLIELAEPRMRRHVVDCLTKSYFTVSNEFAEKSLSMKWEEAKAEFSLTWQQEGDKIVIRKPKASAR